MSDKSMMAAPSSSSVPMFGTKGEEDGQKLKQQHSPSPTPAAAAHQSSSSAPPQQKKKRNQPGNPNPDAEVVALSPQTLMATNRYICEVCNKGFQREQNLQLHRRGHNLPWKLKQKATNKDGQAARRKVYLCPEPSCVHHDPSRALGDLTGIKKHYSRKHGEKKWKCEKCSKRYAVQSDWKAHSKTCGTREYRCDCGTLFSRRDSFITHRAFCDALAQESARHHHPTLSGIGSHLFGPNSTRGPLGLPHNMLSQFQDHNHPNSNALRLSTGIRAPSDGQFDHLFQPPPPPPPPQSTMGASNKTFRTPQQSTLPSPFLMLDQDYNPQNHQSADRRMFQPNKPSFQGLIQLPHDGDDGIQNRNSNNTNTSNYCSAANLFNLGFFPNSSTGDTSINTATTNAAMTSTSNPISSSSSSFFFSGNNQFGGGNMGKGLSTSLFPAGNIIGDQLMSSSGAFTSLLGAPLVQNEPVPVVAPHMSATALLQKAAQMGSTTSTSNSGAASLLRGFGSTRSDQTLLAPSSFCAGADSILGLGDQNDSSFHDLMNSLAAGGSTGNGTAGGYGATPTTNELEPDQRNAMYDAQYGIINASSAETQQQHCHSPRSLSSSKMEEILHAQQQQQQQVQHENFNILGAGGIESCTNSTANGGGSDDRLTRDFLGVGEIVRSMSGGISQKDEHNQQRGTGTSGYF